jgi:hypothetical protein
MMADRAIVEGKSLAQRMGVLGTAPQCLEDLPAVPTTTGADDEIPEELTQGEAHGTPLMQRLRRLCTVRRRFDGGGKELIEGRVGGRLAKDSGRIRVEIWHAVNSGAAIRLPTCGFGTMLFPREREPGRI